MRLALVLGACLAFAACSPKAPGGIVAEAAPPPPPYNSDVDVDEIMVHVMDPAARQFWAGWGETYSKDGLVDISAKTDEEWKKVEDGATTVVLATNTLMLPAYQRKPVDEWNKYAKAVADLAMLGREGADKQDKVAMEDIGGKLDVACDACHAAFRSEKPVP
jgi:hypothetical protein